MATYPLRRYFDAGIPVSLNTDDPLFFGNSLVDEMIAAQQAHRFTRDDIKRLIVSAVEMSWLTAGAKAALVKQFRSMSVWNEVGIVQGETRAARNSSSCASRARTRSRAEPREHFEETRALRSSQTPTRGHV